MLGQAACLVFGCSGEPASAPCKHMLSGVLCGSGESECLGEFFGPFQIRLSEIEPCGVVHFYHGLG
ncbi:hypothetical protein DIJ64_09435 [Mycobacterium leprae]|uniref:Uncharacterized protein n=1 Tax=Mycobacterium leprae TaxID=1769 RepID=A0AAD0P8E0_MYCLR|nr:hypothetical protein [Mycobacterium leprae]AWV48201.1 hypothetical protein DIJ64_09435 [Mycobacterium leprae]OAR20903.1 hypothetical protein A8144_08910 [Mycobacterium leprae 3125609]